MTKEFTINGEEFWIDEFNAGWSWSGNVHESEDFFPTAAEAQQDCLDCYERRIIDAQVKAEDAEDARLYGTPEQQAYRDYIQGRIV